jgi:hypothetical protein
MTPHIYDRTLIAPWRGENALTELAAPISRISQAAHQEAIHSFVHQRGEVAPSRQRLRAGQRLRRRAAASDEKIRSARRT